MPMSDDTVWVVPGTSRTVYHDSPDCHVVTGTDATPVPKRASEVPNHRKCEHCADTVDYGRPPNDDDDDFTAPQEAIRTVLSEAERPVSARDIRFEAHLSQSQVQRVLRAFRESGVVEIVHPPDSDRRRPYYQLTAPDANTNAAFPENHEHA